MSQKEICMSNERYITFPEIPKGTKNLLITGELKNVFGVLEEASNGKCGLPVGKALENIVSLVDYLKQKNVLTLYCDKSTIEYFCRLFTILEDGRVFEDAGIDDVFKYIYANSIVEDSNVVSQWFEKREKKNMKFDYIIQNPPYDGSLHLDFFKLGLNVLAENGKMVIIEPATWLINVRRNGKAKLYDEIKERIKGHVESVVIENLNNEFGTGRHEPFATTTIDMSKTFDTIDFWCCGEHKIVTSLYDCNLIGDYSLIQSILTKCQNFGDVMINHTTNVKQGNNTWYAKYAKRISGGSIGCSLTSQAVGMSYESEKIWYNGFLKGYITPLFHLNNNDIQQNPVCKNDHGNKLTKENAENIYGTKEELENWKYFVLNNKLPLFLNMVLIYSCDNNSKNFVPWLVDRKYTDDEINQLFNFTEEEIKLIDSTLKKFERNSPWFRRYICGKESTSDEEINTYLNGIASC